MMKHLIAAFLFVGLSISAAFADDAYDWRLERDKDGIQIYTSAVEGSSIRAVKAVTSMYADMDQLILMLNDPTKRHEWDENTGDAYVVRELNDDDQVAYFHVKLPWPVQDRDFVTNMVWQRDENGAQMTSTLLTGEVPKNKKRVRVTEGFNDLTLVRADDGLITMSMIAHLDPAGPIPAWLINMLSVDAPYKSLQTLRALVSSPK